MTKDPSRIAFEEWSQLGSEPLDLTCVNDIYAADSTYNAWVGWQAALAYRDNQTLGVTENE